jgi:predicted CxxxxCH...CXXCH cytochrome family protein
LVILPCFLFSCLNSSITAPAVNPNPQDDRACGDCHGSSSNFAPPKDTLGNTSTSNRGVGAHQAHLTEGDFHIALTCVDCHLVPTSVTAQGHLDSSLPAEIIFGELARIGGFEPTWNGTTCSNVYCHGAALGGGTITEPNWTTVNGTQAVCGSCHGIPPPLPHVQQNDCSTCHGEVVNASNQIIDKELHINGEVDVSNDALTCYSCHGSGSSNNAPPRDTSGNTATSFIGVGAHQKHMTTTISANVTCVECHTVPNQITSPGHNDTALPAEVVFGILATTGTANPVWNGSTCANTYCHGEFTGGLGVNPTWTTVNGTQAACGTCHARPPQTGRHQLDEHENLSCSACHGANYSSTTVRIADHINGLKNVGGPGSQIQTWSKPSCNPTCHGSENW